ALPISCARTVDAIKAAGGTALAVGADVSDADAVNSAVERIASELGAPTVLVNNAGIIRDNLLFKMSVDDWDAVMAVHLRGAFNMTKAGHKYMTEAGYGRIVHMSSRSALGKRGQANCAAAKAGLPRFPKTFGTELDKFGLTANVVAPGFMQSYMTAATAERIGVDLDEFIQYSAKQIPVQRVAQPQDVAN